MDAEQNYLISCWAWERGQEGKGTASMPTRLIIPDEVQGWAGFGPVICQNASANHILSRGY